MTILRNTDNAILVALLKEELRVRLCHLAESFTPVGADERQLIAWRDATIDEAAPRYEEVIL
jgi:hypothetical protein